MARRKGISTAKEEVLSSLLFAGQLLVEFATSGYYGRPSMFSCRVPDEVWKQWQRERRVKRAVKEMREKKWMSDRKEGASIVVKLHQDAVAEGLKGLVRAEKKHLSKGYKCLVAFDFPNGASGARDSWRHFLHTSGFTREQLSLWSSNTDVIEAMQALVFFLGIQRWVKVYLAQEKTAGKETP